MTVHGKTTCPITIQTSFSLPFDQKECRKTIFQNFREIFFQSLKILFLKFHYEMTMQGRRHRYDLGITWILKKITGWRHVVWLHSYAVKKLTEFQLEPVCCKKRQKIVPDQLLVWGIRAL